METKACLECKQSRPLEEFQKFWRADLSRHSYVPRCSPCHKARRNAYRQANADYRKREAERASARWAAATPEAKRRRANTSHKSRYGITLEEREAMFEEQDGRCACCGTTDPGTAGWALDHDHSCCDGKKSCGECIRGILCQACNKTLGFAQDSSERLLQAILYLNKMEKKHERCS